MAPRRPDAWKFRISAFLDQNRRVDGRPKINFDCSAFAIVFNRDDGVVEVTACLDHYGHENLPTPSRTPKRMKKRLEMIGKIAENKNLSVNCEDVQCRLLALIDLLPSLPLDVVEKFRTPVSRMEFMIENQHNSSNDNRSQNDDYADGHSSSENEMTTNKKV
uniref:Uncharacterized protein n=1 Tax=Romanomermis culicivorax TaxID=13658 RepID=A0A915L2Y1_ROMCU